MPAKPKLTYYSGILNKTLKTYCGLGDGSLARMKDINNHLGEIYINFIVACVCSSAFQQLK